MRIHAPKAQPNKLSTPIHIAVLTLFASAAQAQTSSDAPVAPPAPAASSAAQSKAGADTSTTL